MAKGRLLGVVPPDDPIFKEPWRAYPVAKPSAIGTVSSPLEAAKGDREGLRIPVVVAREPLAVKRSRGPSPFPAYTAAQIAKIRETLGKTRDEFGKLFGVTGWTIGAWEQGKRPITRLRAFQIHGQLTKLEEAKLEKTKRS